MPEGPEVRVITDELNNLLKNQVLNKLEILGGRYKNKLPDGYNEFINALPLQINSVNCKGKFIWFKLENEWTIWNTLGMSGGWKNKPIKHSDISLTFSENKKIWFTDQRHFGTIKFCKMNLLEKKLKTIGPDLLSDESISEIQFLNKIKKYPNHALPKILMDQNIFSGIGNYLKAEILYQSKISPLRLIKDISDDEIIDVFNNSRQLIKLSYISKGATIRNYSDLSNNNGEYSFKFKVYNRKEDDLGNKVIKTETNDKRSTHWVKEVQI